MTEAEWLTSDDPGKMLDFLARSGGRKRRLFDCACCNRIGRLLTPLGLRVIAIAEDFADGNTSGRNWGPLPPRTVERGWDDYGVNPDARLAASEAIKSPEQRQGRFSV